MNWSDVGTRGCVQRCEVFVVKDAQYKRSARRLNVVFEVKAILYQNVLESVNCISPQTSKHISVS